MATASNSRFFHSTQPAETGANIQINQQLTSPQLAAINKEFAVAEALYQQGLELLNQLEDTIRSSASANNGSTNTKFNTTTSNHPHIPIDDLTSYVETMVSSIERCPDAWIWLSKTKHAENYHNAHCLQVCAYMIKFGDFLKLRHADLIKLGLIGLLQDIGKLTLPQHLLMSGIMPREKATKLFQSHITESLRLLKPYTKQLSPEVIRAIAEHHERYDGSGYPQKVRHQQISRFGYIAGIVDCFDAMISQRSYANACSAQHALRELFNLRNIQFPASLVEQFMNCVGIYSPGCLVSLQSSEVGVILKQNYQQRLKPQVLILMDAAKNNLQHPELLDLADPDTAANNSIVQVLEPGSHNINLQQISLMGSHQLQNAAWVADPDDSIPSPQPRHQQHR